MRLWGLWWVGHLGTRSALMPKLLTTIQSQIPKVLGSGQVGLWSRVLARPSARVQQDRQWSKRSPGASFYCSYLDKVISASVILLPKPSLLREDSPWSQMQGCGPPYLKQDSVKGVPRSLLCALGGWRSHSRLQLSRETEEAGRRAAVCLEAG